MYLLEIRPTTRFDILAIDPNAAQSHLLRWYMIMEYALRHMQVFLFANPLSSHPDQGASRGIQSFSNLACSSQSPARHKSPEVDVIQWARVCAGKRLIVHVRQCYELVVFT
jgi:hypothetical protein